MSQGGQVGMDSGISRGMYWRRKELLIRIVSVLDLKESRGQGSLFPSVEGVVDTTVCEKTE